MRPPPHPAEGRGRRLKGMGWGATLREGVGVAIDALRANKVRSGLTILGVSIGVLVVMVMAAVITGINTSFTDIISSRGPTTFYVGHADWTSGGGVRTGLEEEEPDWIANPPLNAAWASELSQLPGILDVSPVADLTGWGYEAEAGGREVEITLVAVTSDYMEIDNGEIVDGRFFTRTEDQHNRAVAVIDPDVAEDLFGRRDPIGRRIVIRSPWGRRGSLFEVIGVYEPPANLFAGLTSHYVLVPFSGGNKELDFWDRTISFIVRPEPGTGRQRAIDRVYAKMRQLRGLRPGQEDNFAIITADEIYSLWDQMTGVLFAVMVSLSSVGLLVGGVGVIGIMMISVTERTREIGLRKAMGARRRDILWQFLVEAATLTATGGAIGMLLGGGIVWLVNHGTPIPAEVPLWSVIAALAVSVLTGIGFGLYPASRGARLDPVDALRYE